MTLCKNLYSCIVMFFNVCCALCAVCYLQVKADKYWPELDPLDAAKNKQQFGDVRLRLWYWMVLLSISWWYILLCLAVHGVAGVRVDQGTGACRGIKWQNHRASLWCGTHRRTPLCLLDCVGSYGFGYCIAVVVVVIVAFVVIDVAIEVVVVVFTILFDVFLTLLCYRLICFC